MWTPCRRRVGAVRYVDAARSYGRAEEFLGGWLRERPAAADLVVGSKWGCTYTADRRVDARVHEVKDHGPRQRTALATLAEPAERYWQHRAGLP